MSYARFGSAFAAASLVLFIGCGGSSGGKKTTGSGSADAAVDSGAKHPKDAGGVADAGKGGTDDADSGMLMPDAGDEGGSTTPLCDEAKGIPTWTVVDPKLPDFGVTQDMYSTAPSVKGFSGIAFGAGVFVALGHGDGQDVFRYATSTDGVKWTAHSVKLASGTLFTISRIHFRNGKFIFFAEHQGDGFHVHSSADAMTWKDTKVMQDNRAVLDEFDASKKRTVYAGHAAEMRSSTDLVQWEQRTDIVGGVYDFLDIAYGSGHWIATTNGDGPTWGSDDGETWTMLPLGIEGYRIEYGAGVWLATAPDGTLKTGTDGMKFKTKTPIGLAPGSPPRFAGGRFVTWNPPGAKPNFQITVSTDGVTWKNLGAFAPLPPRKDDLSVDHDIVDLDYGNCRYVLAGDLVYSAPPAMVGGQVVETHKPFVVVANLSK